MQKLPDPKTVVDSIADGVVEAAEGPARVAKNVASVAETFASEMKANMDDVKARLPDDADLGIFDGVGRGVMDTFEAVKNQITRVTG